MSDKKKDIWNSRYYVISKVYMTISGIWPYHRLRDRYIRFVPIFIFCFSIFIPQLLYVLTSADVDDIFESVPAVLISITFSIKIASMMFNSKRITSCLKIIEENWLSLNTDVERAILARHSEYGRHLTTFYTVLMHMTAFFYLLKPVVVTLLEDNTANVTKSSIPGASKLPFQVEYGEKLDQYFYPIIIHCYLGVFSHVYCTLAVDTLYYILVQHACGMFSIVGHILEDIGKDSDANFHMQPEKIKDINYHKALDCLRKHLHVIEFAELIESLFTNIFLVSTTLNMICGSISGIRVVMNLSNARDIAAPMAIYIAQLTHLFLQFWQAQFLLDYSSVPYESICKGKWYYTSKRCRKIFLLIMSRTMSPCILTAGKIVTLSIENFGAVLKTSMSYFTVLRSFQ
ncbi:Odorant receptor 230 [Nylanderia fulva]|uniref:Odorant receptor n=1 Tax=Nylanderia fulva TaxID=613905 RepID=A0A6G1LPI9_9HYME|nr:odorant receptor 4-like [Nylanderia fulva]KAF3054380.1 Odorant receptor 230 [Nylanderia fulva]